MRVLECIEGLDRASGVATFVHRVSDELATMGHEVAVVFVKTDQLSFHPSVVKIPATRLDKLPWRPDFVHLHGIWSRFSLKVLCWSLRNRIPFCVSPHGGLMPRVFTQGRVKKFLVWRLLLRPLVRRACFFHATTETEVAACRACGLAGLSVVAPLGVEIPSETARPDPNDPYVLYLGRLSEEKGLENLLSAWRQIAGRTGGRLVLAGPDWRGYRARLEAKIRAERIERVFFAGEVRGEAKDRLFCGASLFVLPSPMENFSSVILEALAHGVPAIATKGTPWAELESARCGWWIEQGAEALAQALGKALALSADERARMGARGRLLASERYRWPQIAQTLGQAAQASLCSAHLPG